MEATKRDLQYNRETINIYSIIEQKLTSSLIPAVNLSQFQIVELSSNMKTQQNSADIKAKMQTHPQNLFDIQI